MRSSAAERRSIAYQRAQLSRPPPGIAARSAQSAGSTLPTADHPANGSHAHSSASQNIGQRPRMHRVACLCLWRPPTWVPPPALTGEHPGCQCRAHQLLHSPSNGHIGAELLAGRPSLRGNRPPHGPKRKHRGRAGRPPVEFTDRLKSERSLRQAGRPYAAGDADPIRATIIDIWVVGWRGDAGRLAAAHRSSSACETSPGCQRARARA